MPIEIDVRNHRKDGTAFWNRLLVSPVFDGTGEASHFFAWQYDVTLEKERLVRLEADLDALETEVEQRTLALTRSEDRLRYVLTAARLGSWSLDIAERRLMASRDCKTNFGYAPDHPFTDDDLEAAIFPEDLHRMRDAVAGSIATRSDHDIEYRVVMPGGEVRWVQVRGQPSYDLHGRPLGMAGITLDISERKRAEEHRALLASELTHRVKNTLATIQAIVNQTLRSAATPDAARATLEARVLALAAARDVLTKESWEGALLAIPDDPDLGRGLHTKRGPSCACARARIKPGLRIVLRIMRMTGCGPAAALPAGGVAVLRKPFALAEVAAAIGKAHLAPATGGVGG